MNEGQLLMIASIQVGQSMLKVSATIATTSTHVKNSQHYASTLVNQHTVRIDAWLVTKDINDSNKKIEYNCKFMIIEKYSKML